MSKRKTPTIKPRLSSDARGPAHDESPPTDIVSRHLPSSAAIRETVESVVIAFVLAFLFRTFEAEAFVIPTGSMAPTLMGRHKDLYCPMCGCEYRVSASDEVTADGAPKDWRHETVAGTCPMCRYTADLGPGNPQHASYPSYNGDRILVEKFAYELGEPERWDVIVFKFPGDESADARTNFIKRLAGLPGETIRIQDGDLWVRHDAEPFQIARKPPDKLLAMLQPVFDNDYMPRIVEDGWPARWRSEPSAEGSAAGAWSSDDHATFHTDGAADGATWLRYHHLVPDYRQWQAVKQGGTAPSLEPRLITNFTAYNTNRSRGSHNLAPDADSLGLYWVGDLALRCTANIENDQGELLFELREGGRQFQCRVDVDSGRATLSISGQDKQHFTPAAVTPVRGPGSYEILFSNCDNELRLWVDGRPVEFDRTTAYDDLDNTLPDPTDYTPVGVASVGTKVRLSHLVLLRDIYYIADMSYAEQLRRENNVSQFRWGDLATVGNRIDGHAEFSLKADQFFALGDNSARSKDGRLWGSDNYWVPRKLLIGKALFVYWPHSWDRTPYVNIPFPYFPNFARMRLVR